MAIRVVVHTAVRPGQNLVGYTERMKGYKLREITRQAKDGSQWFAGAEDR